MARAWPLVVPAVVCGLALALAEPVPPIMQGSEAMPTPTLFRKAVTGLAMGHLKIVFETTTLDETKNIIGVGTVEHQGDASESIYWLCYTVPGHPGPEHVWLIAHGETGGDRHAITSVQALKSELTRASEGCPLLQSRFLPVHFDKGLWLGQTEARLIKELGRPSAKEKGWWLYSYVGKSSGSRGFDTSSLFEAKVQEGKIAAIISSQVTSD
jgi:hypothetical protein